MGGVVPDKYKEEKRKEIPKTSIHVWYWFIRLHNRRRLNDSSINPITYSDIESFTSVNGIDLLSWELHLLEKIDDLFMKNFRESQDKQYKKSQSKSKSK